MFIAYTHLLGTPANFLPFGPTAGDSMVPLADDGSSEEIRLNTDFVFFGRRETVVYVNDSYF